MRFRRIVRLTAVIAGVFAAVSPAHAHRKEDNPEIIPLQPYIDNDHFAFRAHIGQLDGLFQFDTGGGLTIITPQAAAATGCKPWGRLTGFRMRGDRVDAPRCDAVVIMHDGIRLSAATTGVVDLSNFLPKDAPPLLGSIGLDVFADRAVTLDIANKQLIVETPASLKARIAHAVEVPAHVVREVEGYAPTLMVGLDTPAGRVWFTVDSGSDGTVIVGRHVAALFGLDPEKKGAQPFKMSLGGVTPVQTDAHVADLILDGNIGSPVLRRWRLTFDVAHGRMWIAPSETIRQR